MNLQRPVLISLFLFLSLSLFSVNALAKPAGKIKMVIGKALIQTSDGKSLRVRRGKPVSEGDTIVTNNRSQVQLIMLDGSNISIRPATQFKIEEFVATGDVAKDKTHYDLITGGFRSVTGSIGKKNKASFQAKTPVATMGIRGTDFTGKYCQVCPPGVKEGLYVQVNDGGVALSNEGGTKNLSAGENSHTESADQLTQKIDEQPDNFISPKASNSATRETKGNKQKTPSPEQEFVQIATYVAPDLKEDILNEAFSAGVGVTEIVNGALSGGIPKDDVVKGIMNEGKKHGIKTPELIEPLLNSDIDLKNVIEKIMTENSEAASDILTSAIANKAENIEELKALARGLGVSGQQVQSAEVLGNMLAIPEELEKILEEATQNNPEQSNANPRRALQAREVAPVSDSQDVTSPF